MKKKSRLPSPGSRVKTSVPTRIPDSGLRTLDPGLPAIRCAHTRLAALDELKPNPRNPNQHPPEQMRLYKKVVLHQGIRRAIVVSNQSGLIVTGHGLYQLLKELGVKQAPVDFQDFKTPADETAHMLADNRLPELHDLDVSALAALEQDISLAGLDLELTGAMFDEAPSPVTLVDVETQAPPKYTWALIGIPTVRFGEIAERIAELGLVPDIFLETTSNDGPAEHKSHAVASVA